jgi:sulfur-oxidizing protein SoxX
LNKRHAARRLVLGIAAALAAAFSFAQPVAVPGDTIEALLATEPGNAARGRKIVLDHVLSACVLCHAVPDNEGPAGNIAPSLAGIGSRLSAGQLRLRIVDSTRLNPDSVMPAYYRTDGLNRVAPAYRGKPVLSAQQVEDVVAYLLTLK